MFNVIWCESWDSLRDMPSGLMRDCGCWAFFAIPAIVRHVQARALARDWGCGLVVVTDLFGVAIEMAEILPVYEEVTHGPA